MVQLADLFSVPEMYLMSTVTEFFNRNHIDYHPEILFRDVKVGRWRMFSSSLQKYLRLLEGNFVQCFQPQTEHF